MQHTYTTQKQIRAAFWAAFPKLPRRMVKAGPGLYRHATQNEYPTDTRCAFVDFVDALARNGDISEPLAQRATL